MSERLYMDNAATSFPKAPGVAAAIAAFAAEIGASPGRGSYRESRDARTILESCRERLNRLVNGSDPRQVIFTLNTTDALSTAIVGLVRHASKTRGKKIHLVTTAMDHNSVLRPFNALQSEGLVSWTSVPTDPETGLVDPSGLADAITPETALVASVHSSNVSGSLQPLSGIGAICRERGVPLLVDAAQSIGHVPIDVEAMGIDLLAVPGHKGLLGPLGTGALYIKPGLEKIIEPVRVGGTGSVSEQDTHPETMPDRYEAGSHNTLGIAGLEAALRWLESTTVESVASHEAELMTEFLELTKDARDSGALRLLGPANALDRTAVFSFTVPGLNPEQVASLLEDHYGILSRAGIHCAPHAHRTFGTIETGGACRLSFGAFTQIEHVRTAAAAMNEIAAERVAAGV